MVQKDKGKASAEKWSTFSLKMKEKDTLEEILAAYNSLGEDEDDMDEDYFEPEDLLKFRSHTVFRKMLKAAFVLERLLQDPSATASFIPKSDELFEALFETSWQAWMVLAKIEKEGTFALHGMNSPTIVLCQTVQLYSKESAAPNVLNAEAMSFAIVHLWCSNPEKQYAQNAMAGKLNSQILKRIIGRQISRGFIIQPGWTCGRTGC